MESARAAASEGQFSGANTTTCPGVPPANVGSTTNPLALGPIFGCWVVQYWKARPATISKSNSLMTFMTLCLASETGTF